MLTKRLGYLSSLGFLVLASLSLGPVLRADSQKVADLLSDAKAQAFQLRGLTDEFEAYTHLGVRQNLSWGTHTAQLGQIKQAVNRLGETFSRINEARDEASPQQRATMDRLNPALKELATNIQATLDHLKMNRDKITTCVQTDPEYKEIVRADYDLAARFADIISEVD